MKPRRRRKGIGPRGHMLLLTLVDQYGVNAWKEVGEEVPERNARQRRDRYKVYLAPSKDSGPWTDQEKEALRRLLDQYRGKSSKRLMQVVKKVLPNRTQAEVTNQSLCLITQLSTTTQTTETADDELILADGINVDPGIFEFCNHDSW